METVLNKRAGGYVDCDTVLTAGRNDIMTGNADYLHDLRVKATQEGRLVTCVWEVTCRCNLSCRHCFHPKHDQAPAELGTERALELLEELAEQGFLVLVVTGGEPFTRPDIWQILESARRLEFALRIMTNGTLLDRDTCDRLAALEPMAVDLSLYGQRRSHESVTGMPGSFQATCRTGRLLTQKGIKVVVKMPLMRHNLGEYRAVREVANSWGAELATDASIFCRLDGDRAPLDYQASPDQLIEFLFRRAQEAGPYRPGSNLAAAKPERAMCSAARANIFVASDGRVFPCGIWRQELGNLSKQSLEEVLAGPELAKVRALTMGDLTECPTCRLARWCVRCPGLAHLEGGSELGKSPTSCRAAAVSQEVDRRLQVAEESEAY
ncbi:MAG TPA: radical SAM protein [Planctomycetota bacterium]|nr:radical SAM protein [Planctomycetota bacterium]